MTTKDSEQTKRKILMSAKHEFAAKGYNGARMNIIASTAGVNQALLHYHFESKEKLYFSIFHHYIGENSDKYVEMISKELDSWDASPDIELAAVIYLLVCLHCDSYDADLNRIFAREMAEENGVLFSFIKNYSIPRLEEIEKVLKEGVQLGIFEISSTMLCAINIMASVEHYIHGENFFKDTRWHDSLYSDKKSVLFSYTMEQTFKTLRPSDRDLVIPQLRPWQTEVLDNIIKIITDSIYTV